MAIKRTKYDKVFSDYIRTRDGWTCQRCGKYYNPDEGRKRMALDCSHFHGRTNLSVRFDPDNAVALCRGCHQILGSNPDDHVVFFKKRLGLKKYRKLRRRKNKIVKKSQMLNDHFYNELKLMLEDAIARDGIIKQ